MSQDIYMLDVAMIASTNMASHCYKLVEQDVNKGDHYVKLNSKKDGLCYGVLYNKPDANEGATVRMHGTAKIITDATVPAGVAVFAAGNGKIYAGATSGYIVGMSLESSSCSDEAIEVLLTPGNFMK